MRMAKLITLQARDNGVGQKMRQALEDYKAVDERLLSELGRNPTVEEIAEELHMSVEEAVSVRKQPQTIATDYCSSVRMGAFFLGALVRSI